MAPVNRDLKEEKEVRRRPQEEEVSGKSGPEPVQSAAFYLSYAAIFTEK